MHGLTKAAIAILGACLSVSVVDAASLPSVGFNITAPATMDNAGAIGNSGNPAASTLAATDIAGPTAVAQAHWNNIAGTMDYSGASFLDTAGWSYQGYQGGLGYQPSQWPVNEYAINHTLSNVVDSTGSTVSGMSVNWQIGANWRNNGQAGWGFTAGTPNGILMSGGFTAPGGVGSTITVTGIPYAKYDIYVYINGGGNPGGGGGTGTLALPDGVTGTLASQQSYTWGWPGGNFIQGTNEMIFTDNTASGFSLTHAATNWTAVTGIQIVATSVPEPTSIGLIGLGAAALLGRRRLV